LLVVLNLWFVDGFGLIEGGSGDDGLCLIVSGVVRIESGGADLRLKIEDGGEWLRERSSVSERGRQRRARERKRKGRSVT
jgi:hypothetical protein